MPCRRRARGGGATSRGEHRVVLISLARLQRAACRGKVVQVNPSASQQPAPLHTRQAAVGALRHAARCSLHRRQRGARMNSPQPPPVHRPPNPYLSRRRSSSRNTQGRVTCCLIPFRARCSEVQNTQGWFTRWPGSFPAHSPTCAAAPPPPPHPHPHAHPPPPTPHPPTPTAGRGTEAQPDVTGVAAGGGLAEGEQDHQGGGQGSQQVG